MAVKEMTEVDDGGQWVVFGPGVGFAYHPGQDRKVEFESTPTGWDLTVDLSAPDEANKQIAEKLQALEALKGQSGGKTSKVTFEFQNVPKDLPIAVKEAIMGFPRRGNNP